MSSITQEAAKTAQMNADEMEIAAGREREQLEGWVPELAGEEEVRAALEKAFDYRGDITLTRKDGSKVRGLSVRLVNGRYAGGVGRTNHAVGPGSRVNIAYSEIAALAFTGRDNAAGKTFDAWVKKYWKKKAAGEKNIQIEPEKLD